MNVELINKHIDNIVEICLSYRKATVEFRESLLSTIDENIKYIDNVINMAEPTKQQLIKQDKKIKELAGKL
jgi:allophanate hydrolase subunit 1